MAYEMVMPYHLHMPSYFLETFTEYPYLLFYFIIILFYSVGSAYAYISQEYENKKIELYKDRKF